MVDSDTKVPFNEAAFACIDFETTGFSQKSDRVLEVAVVIVQQGQIGDIWTTLINPGDGKALGASHVHGIRKEWLFQAPSFAEIAGDLFNSFDGKVIVAHNVNFDLGFLRAELSRAQLLPHGLLFPNWDTMKAAEFAPKETASKKLRDVAKAFDITVENAHQALDDTLAVAKIISAVTPIIGDSVLFNTFEAPGKSHQSGQRRLRPTLS